MSLISKSYLDSPVIRDLFTKNKNNPKKIALPEFNDSRMQAAAKFLLSENLVSEIHTLQTNSPPGPDFDEAAQKKIFGIEHDSPHLTNGESLLNHAGRLLAANIVDSVLAGAVHTTAEVIRASIATVGLRSGLKTVSGSFLMHRSKSGHQAQSFLFADSGVVIEPTLAQLRDIAFASVSTWNELMGKNPEPVVAFLSFSTKGSAKHPSAQKMAQAAAQFQTEFPQVCSDGEIQFDAAIDAAVGAKKCPGSKIAGRANIFIFPNLDAGNICYKVAQRLGGFQAFGPILQGTGKIYSDLSRGASVEDIITSVLINGVRAHISQ